MHEGIEKFTGKVAEYVRYRERYDPGLVLPLLRDWCGLRPEWTVADIGAGTGMLSDVFLENGNRVIAVEPNAEMRAACAELHRDNPRLEVLAGSAEASGLPEASVEMISAGRALHWFDLPAALLEFRRMLKPGGWVAVVSFGRDDGGREENLAYEEMLRPFTRNDEGTRVAYAAYAQLEQFFAGGVFHHAEVVGEMEMNREELRGKTLSYSHAPLPGSDRFAELERALGAYYERFQSDGKVKLTTRCRVNAGRFAA